MNLERKDTLNTLVLADKNLTWKNHIDVITTKISRNIGLIAKLRHFLPRKTIINIYQALIYPILSYGIVAWGQACKTYLDKILILQKRVIRMIFFADRYDHGSLIY